MADNTIVVKGHGIRKERNAAGTISPGHFVAVDASGTLVVHGTADANASKAIAVENEVFGRGIDNNYVAGDMVLYEVLVPGSEVKAIVAVGTAAITVGDYLSSAGDGTVKPVAASAATSQAQRAGIIGVALESVDNSVGGAPVPIHMEII